MSEPTEVNMITVDDDPGDEPPDTFEVGHDDASSLPLGAIRSLVLVVVGVALMAGATGIGQWVFSSFEDSPPSDWQQFVQSLSYVVAIAGAIVFAAGLIDLIRGRRHQ